MLLKRNCSRRWHYVKSTTCFSYIAITTYSIMRGNKKRELSNLLTNLMFLADRTNVQLGRLVASQDDWRWCDDEWSAIIGEGMKLKRKCENNEISQIAIWRCVNKKLIERLVIKHWFAKRKITRLKNFWSNENVNKQFIRRYRHE